MNPMPNALAKVGLAVGIPCNNHADPLITIFFKGDARRSGVETEIWGTTPKGLPAVLR